MQRRRRACSRTAAGKRLPSSRFLSLALLPAWILAAAAAASSGGASSGVEATAVAGAGATAEAAAEATAKGYDCGKGVRVAVQLSDWLVACAPVAVCCPPGTSPSACRAAGGELVRDFLYGYDDVDVSCAAYSYADAACVLRPPPAQDPCHEGSDDPYCKRGARCGIHFAYDGSVCVPRARCYCDEVGNYAGQRCGIECAPDRAPCSRGTYFSYDEPYGSVAVDLRCCGSNQVCLQTQYETNHASSTDTDCYYKRRPTSCEPNPCKNGGKCRTNSEGYSDGHIHYCTCRKGWTGPLCGSPE